MGRRSVKDVMIHAQSRCKLRTHVGAVSLRREGTVIPERSNSMAPKKVTGKEVKNAESPREKVKRKGLRIQRVWVKSLPVWVKRGLRGVKMTAGIRKTKKKATEELKKLKRRIKRIA
jgi:hypothetical protein